MEAVVAIALLTLLVSVVALSRKREADTIDAERQSALDSRSRASLTFTRKPFPLPNTTQELRTFTLVLHNSGDQKLVIQKGAIELKATHDIQQDTTKSLVGYEIPARENVPIGFTFRDKDLHFGGTGEFTLEIHGDATYSPAKDISETRQCHYRYSRLKRDFVEFTPGQ